VKISLFTRRGGFVLHLRGAFTLFFFSFLDSVVGSGWPLKESEELWMPEEGLFNWTTLFSFLFPMIR